MEKVDRVERKKVCTDAECYDGDMVYVNIDGNEHCLSLERAEELERKLMEAVGQAQNHRSLGPSRKPLEERQQLRFNV